jgi:hypothetical protein
LARPKKQTVDYYPHIVKSGKTLFILETHWGNDGYAFFHKLLETLCSTAGHVIDYGNPAEREFLLAKTRVNEETASAILDKLAELGKIDPELWAEKRIWYQNLVDNIKDAYKKRLDDLPQKPSLRNQKPPVNEFPATETPSERVSGDGSTESKVKKIKVNNNPPISPLTGKLSKTFTDFLEMRKKIKKPMTERAKELLLKKLGGLAETEDAKVAILEQSIVNGWQDIYPLKQERSQQYQRAPTPMYRALGEGLPEL